METNFETFKVGEDDVTKDKLMQDLKAVAHDTEELIKATAGQMGDKAKEARARLSTSLDEFKKTCHDYQEKACAGAKATDQMIREHPYQSMFVTFSAGLVIGLLVNRR